MSDNNSSVSALSVSKIEVIPESGTQTKIATNKPLTAPATAPNKRRLLLRLFN